MRRVFITLIAALALASPIDFASAASSPIDSFTSEYPLFKKKQNFGPAKLNCKNRRTYADYVRCGFI